MANRADELVGSLLRSIHEAIAEHDLSYDEYTTMKQWLIDVGDAGEWPLFLDVFVESAVEQQVFGGRSGSQGTILGPTTWPTRRFSRCPTSPAPPRRARRSRRLRRPRAQQRPHPARGRDPRRRHADADGFYSGFEPRLPEEILRGRARTDADGRYELRTIVPAPYTIPLDGPTGRLCAAAGWSPWRPAHIHLIVSADDHEPLTTQLFIDSSDHLDNDVASAVKEELIVRPRLAEHVPDLSFEYDFTLAAVRTATAVG